MSKTQSLLNGLNNLTGQKVEEETNDCVRRKKVTVTAPAHADETGRMVISVEEPFGEPFDVPYAPALVNVQPGETVWVEWVYGFSNACAVNGGAWQASDLPNCVIPTEDGLEMQVNYQTVMSVNGSGLHVNGTISGNVVNTETATAATVNGKIQDTVDNLGKYLANDVTVTVPAGTYVENVKIQGFHGPGKLKLALASGTYIKGDWIVCGNDAVEIEGTVVADSYPEMTGVSAESAMDVRHTKWFVCSGLALHGAERTASFKQSYGVLAAEGSYVYLHTMVIDRFDCAVYVRHAHADIADCSGGVAGSDFSTVANLVNGVVISPYGGFVNARGSIPIGPNPSAGNYTSNGYPFFIYGQGSSDGGSSADVDTGDMPADGSGDVTPSVDTNVTGTWTADRGYYTYGMKADTALTICVGWLGTGSYNLRMGKDISDKTYMAGIWMLENADTIAATLVGTTITKATVSVTRTSTVGSTNGTQNVVLYYHGLTSTAGYTGKCDPFGKNPESTDKYIDCGCPGQYIALGGTATYELPAAMYPLLQDGTVKGFGVGMNHPTSLYQFGPTSCVLTVTYRMTGVLPDAYMQVDWLECTGYNARIDTGLAGNDETLRMQFGYMVLDQANYLGHFGNYANETTRCWRVIQSTSSYPRTLIVTAGNRRAGSSTSVSAVSAATGTVVGTRMDFDISWGYCEVTSEDGTVTEINPETDTSTENSRNVCVGANNVGATGNSHRGRFWYFKAWSNGALVRDYVPCVRRTDGIAGFYDLVNATFNPSIGSADFIAGTDV